MTLFLLKNIDAHAIFGIILGFLFLVLIFLILREFFCWYWKINKRISLLEEIRDKLSEKKEEIREIEEEPPKVL